MTVFENDLIDLGVKNLQPMPISMEPKIPKMLYPLSMTKAEIELLKKILE